MLSACASSSLCCVARLDRLQSFLHYDRDSNDGQTTTVPRPARNLQVISADTQLTSKNGNVRLWQRQSRTQCSAPPGSLVDLAEALPRCQYQTSRPPVKGAVHMLFFVRPV